MALISFGTLATFTLASFLVELTPGPNMVYLAVLSVTEGRSAGFAATWPKKPHSQRLKSPGCKGPLNAKMATSIGADPFEPDVVRYLI